MKVTRDMKIKDVLAIDEAKTIEALGWLAPEFERLQYPKLRRAMAGRVTVSQAARIARIPLTEMLYVINLALGENEETLAAELALSDHEDMEFHDRELPVRPSEIATLKDSDLDVIYVDLMLQAREKLDPMPAIARGLVSLKRPRQVLLLRHPFDPIPLRDMFARRGYASWAEERKPGEWFIYFFRPGSRTAVFAHPPIGNKVYARAFAATA